MDTVYRSEEILHIFCELAGDNTEQNVETLGILCGVHTHDNEVSHELRNMSDHKTKVSLGDITNVINSSLKLDYFVNLRCGEHKLPTPKVI